MKHFQTQKLSLVNAANSFDQFEPVGKSVLGDLSPLCEITDCLDSHCNYCILYAKIALTMVYVTSAKQMAFVQ